MSIANNQLAATASQRIGASMYGQPIIESMLNDVAVEEVRAAEVTSKGKCIAFAFVNKGDGNPAIARPIASATGDVKLYPDAASVVRAARSSSLQDNGKITIAKMLPTATVGDPIAMLKARHKAAVKEAASSQAALTAINTKVAGAQSLGWDTAPAGSAEKNQFDDFTQRAAVIAEWNAANVARVTQYASALTTAGIDPATYLPLPTP